MKKTGLITLEYVHTVIKERDRELHKGDCGKILVIAGSKGMAGAAVLCGRGALRTGAGLVRVSIEEELYPIIQTALPEATCVPRQLSKLDLGSYDAIALGPGLGDGENLEGMIEYILKEYKKTIVLDADGLNALAKNGKTRTIESAAGTVIITPHIGEAKRLIYAGGTPKWWPESKRLSQEDRVQITQMLLEETRAIVVLKGAGTIVASEQEGTYTNTTGNPGMATGGSGDVLTGIIAGLAGQDISPWDSAKAGVFLHGLAGDLAAEDMGEYGMTAADIANKTALAVKSICSI